MNDPLRRAVALARDAGESAARTTRQIALGNTDPEDPGTTRHRWLGNRLSAVGGPPVTAAQVQQAGRAIRDFSAELVTVNRLLAERGGDPVDDLADASDDLSFSTAAAAEANGRVNDALADLERIRIALVLGRPLTDRTG